jgi:uncharacterized LabA/DUF88 family protein
VGKNVAVFVDVANIFYAAKAAGVDIDYVTLLKSAIAGRDFVRAYAYTGLDPDNENQRNFHSFLARHSYKVVSKDIRKYGDGKVKANLDIELVVDLMKTARNLDVAIIVSGDGDFAPAIRAVQEMGVRCEVISFRGNTSSDLIEVADLFTDITQIAKVEKGSSRSGRRVADDEEDLSMTEVPDKQTEGTGIGRGRGSRTGRGRTRVGEPEPVAAAPRSTATRPAARGGRRPAEPVALEAANEGSPAVAVGASVPSFGGLVALPGEKLSKAAVAAAARVSPPTVAPLEADLQPDVDAEDAPEVSPVEGEGETEEGQRRRRRRGGRGRGRGRSRAEGEPAAGTGTPPREIVARPLAVDEEEEEEDVPVAPRPPRSAAFGSFWDSQIGMDRPPAASLSPIDVDDEDEPAIPEYLIAEQRRGSRDGGRDTRRPGSGAPNRGGRAGSYAAAMERERFGRGGGGGINRYPDVSGRRPEERSRSDERPAVAPRQDRPRSGDEPWSEVPPELEAMLRAQIASKPGRPPKPADAAPAEPAAVADSGAADLPGPKRRTTSRRAAEPVTPVGDAGPASGRATADATAEAPTPRRRSSTRATAELSPAAPRSGEAPPAAAPAARRRAATRTATPVTPAEVEASPEAAAPAPKRRSARKVAE